MMLGQIYIITILFIKLENIKNKGSLSVVGVELLLIPLRYYDKEPFDIVL